MGRNVGILQQVERHELVVLGRLGVVEDLAQLLQVPGAKVVVDIGKRFLGQDAQALWLHHQHLFALERRGRDVVGGELAVGRGVRAQGNSVEWR